MIKVSFKNVVAAFAPSSLGQNLLDQLRDTETLAKFKEGGENKWRAFWTNMPPKYSEQDSYKIRFFCELLGTELYARITDANDYAAAFAVQNSYFAWGRANVADITSERIEEYIQGEEEV